MGASFFRIPRQELAPMGRSYDSIYLISMSL